jgi:hypothetical protein
VLTAILIVILICFSIVIFFGAPYLPTLKKEKLVAIELLDLKKGELLLELGSGDGRMLKEMAKKEVFCVGYELNPILVLISRLICWPQRKFVTIKWANFWTEEFPDANGIYVFLLDRYMEKLNEKILNREKRVPLKLVSYAFKVPKKKYVQKKGALFLYQY